MSKKDSFIEAIGRLKREREWLARQLALTGALPFYTPDGGRSAEDVAQITDAWVAKAERIVADSQETASCQI